MTDSFPGPALLQLPVASLASLHRALAHGRAPAEAAQLARRVGFDSGEGFHDALAERIAREAPGVDPGALPQERFWPLLADFFSSLGWGRLDFEPLHPGVASLVSDQWAEAEQTREAAHPSCHLTTGLLSDLLSRVAGTDLAVMEVECRSRADDRCRFLVGSPDALAEVYERLRDGAGLPEALEELR